MYSVGSATITIGLIIKCVIIVLQFALLYSAKASDNWHYFGNNLSCSNECNWPDLLKKTNFNVDLRSIQILSITGTPITDISGFPDFSNLQVFNLSNNLLSAFTMVSPKTFPALNVLDLQHNNFETLSNNAFAAFPNLEILDLRWNKLTTIKAGTFSFYKLRHLRLGNNNLSVLDENTFRFSPSLEFVDLSYNNLNIVKTSSLAQAQRLIEINLSHNHIIRFEHNSFLPLSQLRVLDLSFNEILDINGGDFQQLTGLQRIDLSGNPILIIQTNNFFLPSLEELLLSGCQHLRVIDSNAFAQMPRLQLLNLDNSTALQYLSPTALPADKIIDRLLLKNSALEILSEQILQNAKHISVENNRLQCGCIRFQQNQASRLRTNSGAVNNITCLNPDGNRRRISAVSAVNDTCDLQPILPFGAFINVTVGDTISLYCVPKLHSDQILWTLPNKLQELQNRSQIFRSHELHRFDIPTYYAAHSSYYNNVFYRPRFTVEHEKIRFDVVTVEDSGIYRCTVRRGQETVEKTIMLNVLKPQIQLRIIEAGPYYITVAWNASLNVKAKERVIYFLSAQSTTSSSNRVIQLSLYNPWHNYNVVRLKPDTNYTICLSYALRDNAQEIPLYKSCTSTSTLKNPAVFGSVGIIFLTLLSTSSLIFCFITCLNFIHFRIDISQHEKHRSRMNQSTSGQSILPRSSREPDITMSFENFCQNHRRNSEENDFHLAIIDSTQPTTSRDTEPFTVEDLNL